MNIYKIINLLTLIFFLYWSYDISKEDLASNKITNKKIVYGIYFLFFFFFIQLSNTILGVLGYNNNFLILKFYHFFFINFFFVLISGIILWYGGIWPAGDAKFYMVSTLFLPLIKNDLAGFPNYLWLSLLINTFIIAGIYSISRFLYDGYQLKRKGDLDAFREIREFKDKIHTFFSQKDFKNIYIKILNILFSLGIIFLGKQILNMYMMGLIGRVFEKSAVIYFFLFFAWEKIGGYFQSKLWKIIMSSLYLFYFIFGYFYFKDEIMNNILIAFYNVLKFSFILSIGRFFLEYLLEKKGSYWVGENEIKEGMIVSTYSLNAIKNNKELTEVFEDYYKDGISTEQKEALKKWLKTIPKEKAKIEMVKGYPFALWILLGALFEIFFNKSILTFLR